MKLRLLFLLSLIIPLGILLFTLGSKAIPFSSVDTYADSNLGGSSRIAAFESIGDSIFFEAVLGDKAKFPVVTLSIHPDSGFWTVTSYDYIDVILGEGSTDFNFTLLGFDNDFSVQERQQTHRYYQLEQTTLPNERIRIPIRSLITPAWWYSMNNTRREEFGNPDFSQITGMVFSNYPRTQPGDTIRFALRDVTLRRSSLPALKALLLLIAVWSVIFLVRKMRPKQTERTIAVRPQEIASDTKRDRIITAIAEQYSSSSFTQESLAESTGISAYHIRSILKEEFQLSFKEYLKQVRIIEAKRLLTETECDIKEISYRTGFSHPSAFTRSFKEETSLSPSQYRSNNS